MYYSMFVMMADSNKFDKQSIFISLKKESQEDTAAIISKLNSLAKSKFYINSKGFLCSINYLAQAKQAS